MTQLGLVEMTRKKIRERLSDVLEVNCPCCKGSGRVLSFEVIARFIEAEIRQMCDSSEVGTIQIDMHPTAAQAFSDEHQNNLRRLENTFNKKIVLKACKHFKLDEFVVKGVDNPEVIC